MAQVDTDERRLPWEGGFLLEMLKRSLEACRVSVTISTLRRATRPGRAPATSAMVDPKRLGTEIADVDMATPRDRNGTFDPSWSARVNAAWTGWPT